MNYTSVIEKFDRRLLWAFFSALFFRLTVNIVLALAYRNYSLYESFYTFHLTLIFSALSFELFNLLNRKLEFKTPWINKPKRRFLKQIAAQSLMILFLYLVFMIAGYFTGFYQLYVLKIEIVNLVVLFFMLLGFNSIELGKALFFKWQQSQTELERIKIENAEFKFEMLKNQISPHFLFNSLNTVSSLIYSNKDIASEYLRKLSNVYRFVLEQQKNELILLKAELEFIKSFTYLYKLRFREMLNFTIDIDEDLHEHKVVPLTLQLLIENAVKHNIASRKRNLSIRIFTENNFLVVENNLQRKQNKEYSSNLGLENLRSRYAYVSDKEIVISETETLFKVKVPLL